ncbi:MAG: 50S ribosomal protein L5 [Planctomycetota bacterium]
MLPLIERYKQVILPALKLQLGATNIHALPRLEKVSVNVGIGFDGVADAKIIDFVKIDLAALTGQRPLVTKVRKAVSNFKIRDGMPVGLCVTLRRRMMFNFVDKLINLVLPRIRDFRGVNEKSFDQAGNYGMGLKEHLIFPEIDIEKVQYHFGMDINFVIGNSTPERSYALLKLMGMPFRDKAKEGA